ncbi:very short patch repair endonuclease [Nisaea acidiphila]|uniref:very short patch repair endonuclease n=1 Tax=Nisaea acidiphila TaxID=1862145 RepID=UPI0035631B8A
MDTLSQPQRSRLMSRVRSKNTKPELMLRNALWKRGHRYRLGKMLPGKPDVSFGRGRVAIFVDGCFWHGCPEHGSIPKTNTTFWISKIARNMERDRHVNFLLENMGWHVIRVWEHEIEHSLTSVVTLIETTLTHRREIHT